MAEHVFLRFNILSFNINAGNIAKGTLLGKQNGCLEILDNFWSTCTLSSATGGGWGICTTDIRVPISEAVGHLPT